MLTIYVSAHDDATDFWRTTSLRPVNWMDIAMHSVALLVTYGLMAPLLKTAVFSSISVGNRHLFLEFFVIAICHFVCSALHCVPIDCISMQTFAVLLNGLGDNLLEHKNALAILTYKWIVPHHAVYRRKWQQVHIWQNSFGNNKPSVCWYHNR